MGFVILRTLNSSRAQQGSEYRLFSIIHCGAGLIWQDLIEGEIAAFQLYT